MFSTASFALQFLMKERDKRAEKEKTQRPPLEITLYINDRAVSLDPNHSSVSTTQSQGTLSDEDKKKGNLQDKAKIQIRVPKAKRRQRH